MNEIWQDERFVWFLMRGTGVVLVALLTLATALGVASTARTQRQWWPQFATQAVHRTVSLLAVALMLAHTASAVVHGYVDIRWWNALVPFTGTYEPLWVGLGTVAFDVVILVTATSLVRRRLSHRAWRVVHVSAYAAWAVGIVHGLGIGTDASSPWAATVTAVCLGVVGAAFAVRARTLYTERRHAPGPEPQTGADLAPRSSARPRGRRQGQAGGHTGGHAAADPRTVSLFPLPSARRPADTQRSRP